VTSAKINLPRGEYGSDARTGNPWNYLRCGAPVHSLQRNYFPDPRGWRTDHRGAIFCPKLWRAMTVRIPVYLPAYTPRWRVVSQGRWPMQPPRLDWSLFLNDRSAPRKCRGPFADAHTQGDTTSTEADARQLAQIIARVHLAPGHLPQESPTLLRWRNVLFFFAPTSCCAPQSARTRRPPST